MSTSVAVQADAPPVGSVEVTMLPVLSTAMQRLGVGQATPFSELVPSTLATVQADAPRVGSVDTSALPPSSTATHKLVDGHDTASRALVSLSDVTFHEV